MLGSGIGVKNLEQALRNQTEASIDTGTAGAGSAVGFLEDLTKSWPINLFASLALVEITAGTGAGQVRLIGSNTATRLTPAVNFNPAPDATSTYRIATYGQIFGDIKSWGGVALTGRNISLDLAQLDVALSTRASQATVAALLAQLDVALSTRASQATVAALLAQLDVALSTRASEVTLGTRASEATLAKFIPIAKADLFNVALPAAESSLLGANITPTNSPSYIRIYICISIGGIFRVARTVGGTTRTEDMNSSTALAVGAGYAFDVPWRTGDSINFRFSATGGTINTLRVDEIGAE